MENYEDNIIVNLQNLVLFHLKELDKEITFDMPGEWKSNLESKIVYSWIIRIIEDKFGAEMTADISADIDSILETVCAEIAKTLQYSVNSVDLYLPAT